MSELSPLLLIVDYNLTRVADVAHLAQAAKVRHQANTILIRADPGARDFEICTHVIDLDPLAEHFVDTASERLAPYRSRLRAGLVFSDNAVQRGAELLERLGLAVDSAALAAGAFNKRSYRLAEGRARPLLEAQGLLAPASVEVRSVDDLRAFAASHPDGFVVKPSCEGNNRGVTIVRAGDSLDEAFDAVRPYLHHGAICETLIPYRREYSFDGVGDVEFVTEKLSASGKYPVEIAQILPARLSPAEQATLTRAGRLANLLVGQRRGAFHNEIKLSDDGLAAAVVEPNRRPAGMKIWTIAQAVYGIDFYAQWLDAAFGEARPATPAAGATQGRHRDARRAARGLVRAARRRRGRALVVGRADPHRQPCGPARLGLAADRMGLAVGAAALPARPAAGKRRFRGPGLHRGRQRPGRDPRTGAGLA